MREVEERFGASIEEVIRRFYLQEGLTIGQVAERLEVPRGTLANWMVQFHITRREIVAEASQKACG